MFHPEHVPGEIEGLDTVVRDDETGLIICLINPAEGSGGYLYLKERDAKRLCAVLNGYVDEVYNTPKPEVLYEA